MENKLKITKHCATVSVTQRVTRGQIYPYDVSVLLKQYSQLTFTWSKSTIEEQEKGVKYVQR